MEIHDMTTSQKLKVKGQKLKVCRTLLPFAFCLLTFALPSSAAVSDGYIVKVSSSSVYLDWGKASGVQPGDQFNVFRPGETLKHPVTGEILGRTDTLLGQGVIDRIDEKYSTGVIAESKNAIKAGDRTHRVEKVSASSEPVLSPTATIVVMPKEIWRSEPIGHQVSGIALGDIDGDGKKEVVVAFRDQIEVFRWNGTKLESLVVFKNRGYSNFLSVETGDLDSAGHDKIFASLFVEGVKRSRTVVLDYSQGALHEVSRMDGFVRAIEHADGKRELVWQDMALSRELRMKQPATLVKTEKGFRPGSSLKLSHPLSRDQLFGFAWGDWDGDGAEDLAILQNGERLRVLFQNAKWSSGETYGGTHTDFGWDNDQQGSIYPRLLNLRTSGAQSQLLVPHNISMSPIRLAHLKIFRNSELVALAWNRTEMAPVWKLSFSGELADFAVADAMQRGVPQLWTALFGSSDKTIFIVYQLP